MSEKRNKLIKYCINRARAFEKRDPERAAIIKEAFAPVELKCAFYDEYPPDDPEIIEKLLKTRIGND